MRMHDEAMQREIADMEAISAHTRAHATPRGTTVTLRSPETGRLLRALIALYPDTDPRPRPVALERKEGPGEKWRPWLEGRWERGALVCLRDHHGPVEADGLPDDDQEDLRAMVDRLNEGGVGDEEDES